MRLSVAARLSAVFLVALLPLRALAQAGPTFRADNPETLERHHFQINLGLTGDRGPTNTVYQAPIMDVNYGLNRRVQLLYVLPFAITDTRSTPTHGKTPMQPGSVTPGLGQSLLGANVHVYQHHPGDRWFERGSIRGAVGNPDERETSLSISIFPRVTFKNMTHNAGRNTVQPGPALLLPLDVSTREGPLRIDGEAGYYLFDINVPRSWITGVVVSHEFRTRTRIGVELYNQQEANRTDAIAGRRETTLGLGAQQALNKRRTVNLTLLGGRSFEESSNTNAPRDWFAYACLRFVLWPRRDSVPLQVSENLRDEVR